MLRLLTLDTLNHSNTKLYRKLKLSTSSSSSSSSSSPPKTLPKETIKEIITHPSAYNTRYQPPLKKILTALPPHIRDNIATHFFPQNNIESGDNLNGVIPPTETPSSLILSDLSTQERYFAHKICDRLGLISKSFGLRKERKLKIDVGDIFPIMPGYMKSLPPKHYPVIANPVNPFLASANSQHSPPVIAPILDELLQSSSSSSSELPPQPNPNPTTNPNPLKSTPDLFTSLLSTFPPTTPPISFLIFWNKYEPLFNSTRRYVQLLQRLQTSLKNPKLSSTYFNRKDKNASNDYGMGTRASMSNINQVELEKVMGDDRFVRFMRMLNLQVIGDFNREALGLDFDDLYCYAADEGERGGEEVVYNGEEVDDVDDNDKGYANGREDLVGGDLEGVDDSMFDDEEEDDNVEFSDDNINEADNNDDDDDEDDQQQQETREIAPLANPTLKLTHPPIHSPPSYMRKHSLHHLLITQIQTLGLHKLTPHLLVHLLQIKPPASSGMRKSRTIPSRILMAFPWDLTQPSNVFDSRSARNMSKLIRSMKGANPGDYEGFLTLYEEEGKGFSSGNYIQLLFCIANSGYSRGAYGNSSYAALMRKGEQVHNDDDDSNLRIDREPEIIDRIYDELLHDITDKIIHIPHGISISNAWLCVYSLFVLEKRGVPFPPKILEGMWLSMTKFTSVKIKIKRKGDTVDSPWTDGMTGLQSCLRMFPIRIIPGEDKNVARERVHVFKLNHDILKCSHDYNEILDIFDKNGEDFNAVNFATTMKALGLLASREEVFSEFNEDPRFVKFMDVLFEMLEKEYFRLAVREFSEIICDVSKLPNFSSKLKFEKILSTMQPNQISNPNGKDVLDILQAYKETNVLNNDVFTKVGNYQHLGILGPVGARSGQWMNGAGKVASSFGSFPMYHKDLFTSLSAHPERISNSGSVLCNVLLSYAMLNQLKAPHTHALRYWWDRAMKLDAEKTSGYHLRHLAEVHLCSIADGEMEGGALKEPSAKMRAKMIRACADFEHTSIKSNRISEISTILSQELDFEHDDGITSSETEMYGKIMNAGLSNSEKKIVFFYRGQSSYSKVYRRGGGGGNDEAVLKPTGYQLMKERVWKKLGWTVCIVPFYDWDGKSKKEKKLYLQDKLPNSRTM